MKILLLNHSDSGGGAAIASVRLLNALRDNNIDTTLGVVQKASANNHIISLLKPNYTNNKIKINNKFSEIIRNIIFKSSNPLKLHSTNNKSYIDINYINNSSFDLVHLHWINNNMISIKDISKIKKPIVWTMHDYWVISGAEHYPNILENDDRYIQGYSAKNKPKTTNGIDLCRKTWNKKKNNWKNCKFNFISPSNYLKDSFEKCALFRNSKSNCYVIHNIIPHEIFKPSDKNNLKELYNIPKNKKIIGFGAAYDVNDKKSIKGGFLLKEALKLLNEKSNYYLIIFGNDCDALLKDISIPAFSAGIITNPYILASIYNLCDVFVCPSLLENLPNVCLEAMFCGVPVTAFNTGGIPEIVEHQKTGYLARCFDAEDLLYGINFCINNFSELSNNSLKKAKLDFNNENIVNKHIELYKSILKQELT